MRKDTYRIGDGTFAFSPAVFDSLLGHGAKGAARMRELAGAMHVSISSIKDWRRGTHAPSDFEKVEDELFVALVVGRCEFLCEYQDEIDEVYHGLFEKRI